MTLSPKRLGRCAALRMAAPVASALAPTTHTHPRARAPAPSAPSPRACPGEPSHLRARCPSPTLHLPLHAHTHFRLLQPHPCMMVPSPATPTRAKHLPLMIQHIWDAAELPPRAHTQPRPPQPSCTHALPALCTLTISHTGTSAHPASADAARGP